MKNLFRVFSLLLLTALFVLPAKAAESCAHPTKTKISETPAACTSPGETVYVCDVCGETLTETAPALGHNYKTAGKTAATCTEDGSVTYRCARCGDAYTEALPAKGHNYTEIARKAATCTQDGSVTYRCKRCRDRYKETLKAPGHKYKKTRTEPTCTEAGNITAVCARCGDTRVKTLRAKGHDYQKKIKAPTCTKAGKTVFTCVRCGDVYTEATPKLGHDYTKKTVPATCTKAGKTVFTCTRCGKEKTKTLSPLGHRYGEWTVIKPATYRASGKEIRYCVRGDKKETRTVPRLTHKKASECAPGDADMDGKVTTEDARLILRLAMGLDDGLDAAQRKKADFDGKDGVTTEDARYTLRVSMGMDPYAPTLEPGYTYKGRTARNYAIAEKDGVTYIVNPYGYTLIANKTYSLPAAYAPGDLTKECRAAYNEMAAAAAKDGVNLFIVSGYRSWATQDSLYRRYAAQDGTAAADTYSARPGHSEHQTGLAMDLNSLSGSFANTKEGKWLAANAHKYGFIIRYQKDKQSITGYIYEPWHVRYLGKELAAEVYGSGECLEEYFGITSTYG